MSLQLKTLPRYRPHKRWVTPAIRIRFWFLILLLLGFPGVMLLLPGDQTRVFAGPADAPLSDVALSQKDLAPNAPHSYEVKSGDTLWHIAARFLNNPGLWQQLWQNNLQIENPDLIYPGDRLLLHMDVSGRPSLERQTRPPVKWSPAIRFSDVSLPVPALPLDKIAPFVDPHQILDPQQLASNGYISGVEDQRTLASVGDDVYVFGANQAAVGRHFYVYRPQPHTPVSVPQISEQKQAPGHSQLALKYLATLELSAVTGDTARMRVIRARQELKAGDRVLLKTQFGLAQAFSPSLPTRRVQGRIISLLEGLRYGGQYSVVVISLGTDQHLKVGNVLNIYQPQEAVKDLYTGTLTELPDENIGRLMVFRTFEQMSYALVMTADKPVTAGNRLRVSQR